jgi:hypothetical protein
MIVASLTHNSRPSWVVISPGLAASGPCAGRLQIAKDCGCFGWCQCDRSRDLRFSHDGPFLLVLRNSVVALSVRT